MTWSYFERDEAKDRANQAKHHVSLQLAQLAFSDPYRVIAQDIEHSRDEGRTIRIYDAGYWRKGKAIYEREN